MRLSTAILAACVLAVTLFVGNVWPFSSDVKVKGAIIPLYSERSHKPAAVVRVERIFKDYKRKGFYRIGLLPMMVGEGVTIEIPEPAQFMTGLDTVQRYLQRMHSDSAIELRRVKFTIPQQSIPLVEAGRATPGDQGQWHLSDGVVIQTRTNNIRVNNATLQITGKDAGNLTWSSSPDVQRCNLFSLASDSVLQTSKTK